MAKEYFEKLSKLVGELDLQSESAATLEVKHFFSGAALYADSEICASWSPAGLAFRLPAGEADDLINNGVAKPLKYFERGHIKSGYALFDDPGEQQPGYWKDYFLKAIAGVLT